MKKVIVATPDEASTGRWHSVLQRALPEFDVVIYTPGAGKTGARYAVVWSPPESLFREEPQLEALFTLGAGVDNVLTLPSLPSDITVLRLEDAGMASQMAEYVVYGLAGLSRGFRHYEDAQRQGHWAPLPATRYQDWPVGVMGLGKLGGHVAGLLSGLGYPVAGWARSAHVLPGVDVYSGKQQLRPFLARTRVLVNLLPLTPETRGIIDADLLNALLPDAVVINIARGGHVVDDDLLAALDSGRVQAAMLDVFNEEPLPPNHPYWCHPKVRVTPHVAAVTLEADAVAQIRQRLLKLERGEAVTGVVGSRRGY